MSFAGQKEPEERIRVNKFLEQIDIKQVTKILWWHIVINQWAEADPYATKFI